MNGKEREADGIRARAREREVGDRPEELVRNLGNDARAVAGLAIGIDGAAGDQWAAVATVEDGKPPASVYDPADAIAGAAKYLIAHGVQTNVQSAIFAYNHLDSYVTAVLGWASI